MLCHLSLLLLFERQATRKEGRKEGGSVSLQYNETLSRNDTAVSPFALFFSQHAVYVWLDALTNYLTVSGYATGLTAAWAPDVQVKSTILGS